jgi:hypothetical protein
VPFQVCLRDLAHLITSRDDYKAIVHDLYNPMNITGSKVDQHIVLRQCCNRPNPLVNYLFAIDRDTSSTLG